MPFSWWQILILAVLQGVAEFLPISSSGHLVVLAPLLFGTSEAPPDMTAVNISLHIGTLGSILIYYHRRIARLLGEDRRTLGLIVIGSIPAAIVGLLIELGNEHLIEQPLLAGYELAQRARRGFESSRGHSSGSLAERPDDCRGSRHRIVALFGGCVLVHPRDSGHRRSRIAEAIANR
jgi:hypothetical protein